MKVLKFGGSSVAKPERIKQVINILKKYYSQGEEITVVFSAFGGVTDSLIQMSHLAAQADESYLDVFNDFSNRHLEAARSLISAANLETALADLKENHEVLKNLLQGVYLVREASKRTMDYVLSFGERNSCYIIASALISQGVNAEYLDARKIIKTDRTFGAAKVQFEITYSEIQKYYKNHPAIQIVTGFIATAIGGLTSTLGRGGSDYTASLLAAGLNAERIEIWTDVNGVLTADPRKVKSAFTIPTLTYAEAMEMSHFGAKVIYPPTLQPALKKQIPIVIKNTFNPDHAGSFISNKSDDNGHAVKGISSIGEIALLTLEGSGLFGVPGISARLFGALAQAKINIIMITQGSSEHSISFAIAPKEAKKAQNVVEQAFEYELLNGVVEPIKVEKELSVIALIGENMRFQPGIAGRLFQALGKNGINCVAIAQGSSELNVSVVIPKVDEAKSLNALHEAFFLSDTQDLHLFMVGVGLIGSTLINQIKSQADYLLEKHSLRIRLVGIANSKNMLFNDEGINLDSWKEDLAAANEKMGMASFVDRIENLNLSNSIFVDNTASEEVASFYESILAKSISISTPNKIATSSSLLQYQRLKTIAKKRGVKFMYETNVGAGLPVITTLVDLINSGDEVIKIEGVLSGSLSFIFNSFNADRKFSEVVTEAREKGYTEPDPRIDINGIDVRRKLIILARETGLGMTAENVEVKNILSDESRSAKTVEEFLSLLPKEDVRLEAMRAEAEEQGKVLRMIAKLDKGVATIGLEAVDLDHPFASLSGSDNMIVFTTKRYNDRPLVITGPGAGAEVTAAGVFAEVISIGHFLS